MDLNRRVREYESLLEIGVQLAGSLDLAQVLELALDRAEMLCQAETSSIWELDDHAGELFFRVVRGAAAHDIKHHRVPVGQGIVGSVASRGEGEIVDDVASDPRWRGDFGGTFKTHAILAVPLLAQGRVVGVLQMLNAVGRPSFDRADLDRMRLFAAPLGQSIENARLYAALESRFLDTVTALAEAIEKRDPYTAGHVRRVVGYALLLGQELGLERPQLNTLRLAATLHDVGKIAVPDDVLRKDGPLDDDEARVMRRHPVDGAEIVGRIGALHGVLPGVRSHHERLDGRGYPDGLTDPEIPLLARIIAVADTWDALCSDRPYRSARDPAWALDEVRRSAGSQLCPKVVRALERVAARGELSASAGAALVGALFGDRPGG